MEIVLDACLAMLAATGIWFLGRQCIDAWFDNYLMGTAIYVSGNAFGLERFVQRQLRRTRGKSILLVDRGLNEHGKNIVKHLLTKDVRICFFPLLPEEQWVNEAETWMKIGNKME